MKKVISALLTLVLVLALLVPSYAAAPFTSDYFGEVHSAAQAVGRYAYDDWENSIQIEGTQYETQLIKLLVAEYRKGNKSGEILLEGLTKEDISDTSNAMDFALTVWSDTLALNPSIELRYNEAKKQILVVYSGTDVYAFGGDMYSIYTEEEFTGEAKIIFDSLIQKAKSMGSDRDKLRVINDWVYANATYNYALDQGLNGPAEILVNKTGICQGYAELAYRFADELGIPVANTSMNDSHLTTLVYVENKWHVMDLTDTSALPKNMDEPVRVYRTASGELIKMHRKESAFLVPLDNHEWMVFYLNGRDSSPYSTKEAEVIFYANTGYYGLEKYTSYRPSDSIEKYIRPVSQWVEPTSQPVVTPESVYVPTPTPIPDGTSGTSTPPPTGGLTGGGSVSFGPSGITSVGTAARPSTNKFMVKGKQVAINSYLIAGNNYVKLRDLAQAINKSEKNFEITWNGKLNAIEMKSKTAYTPVGGELVSAYSSVDKMATVSTSKIYADGKLVPVKAYTIEGNNYFLLRDIGSLFNFGVAWDGPTQSVLLNPSVGYTK